MYCIIRTRFNASPEVVEIDLTLEEAQAHCQRDDTRGESWFDGYTDEDNHREAVEAFRNDFPD